MRTFTRSVGLIVASSGAAAALAFTGAPASLAANQALMLNGLAAGDLTQIVMSNILSGAFDNAHNYARTNVHWPAQAKPVTGPNSLTLTESVNQGVANLKTDMATALTQIGPGETVTVVGLSAGNLVVDEYLRYLVANPSTAPSKSQLNVVIVADGNRVWLNKNRYDQILKYNFQAPPQTKYNTTVVTGEYDGFADFPDRPWNLVADANALAGTIVVHVPVMFSDLSKVPSNYITTSTNSLGGVTTNYLVPAATLPIVDLFPFLKPQEAKLKKIIDAGYTRNDPNKPPAASTSSTTTAAATAAADTASAPADTASAPSVSASAPKDAVASAPKPSTVAQRVARAAGGLGLGHRGKNAKAADSAAPASATRSASQ